MESARIPEFEEYPTALASRIACRFDLPAPVEAADFPDKGNINQHTYLLSAGRDTPRRYLLQQINQRVFRRPASVMAAMVACIEAQKRRSTRDGIGRWETIELVPTRDGQIFLTLTDYRGTSYWRLMKMIEGCHSFKSLSEVGDRSAQLRVAEQAGRGLAIFGDQVSDMDVSELENPLPGYRETVLYYAQLHSVLADCRTVVDARDRLPDDPVLRNSTEELFLVHLPPQEYRRRLERPEVQSALETVLSAEGFALALADGMTSGAIRTVAVHGDTKLDNFLFDEGSGEVRALVDLDTIMPHTWLSDWGDMVRSLCNVAGEKERERDRIRVDLEVYSALARGFLSTSRTVQPREIELMADAVEIIALELAVRFLTDYLRGDNYFRLAPTDPPDLNLVRGLNQLTLYQRLQEAGDETRRMVRRHAPSGGRS